MQLAVFFYIKAQVSELVASYESINLKMFSRKYNTSITSMTQKSGVKLDAVADAVAW